jgi:hypothetical protein
VAWHTAVVLKRFRLLPITLTLAVATCLAGGASSASAMAAGVSMPGVQGLPVSSGATDAAVDNSLDRAKQLGAKLIRVEVLWSDLEPRASGVRDQGVLARTDRIVADAAARGMRVLLLVDGTPCWASTAPADERAGCDGADPNRRAVTSYPPRDPADYVAVSTFLADRYGTKLAAFEIWNEPDQSNELYWAGPDKVKRYVALAQAVYGPMKVANPRLTVLAGSFVGTDGKWLQALYDAGIKGSYDALSVHFYDLPLEALRTTRAVQRKNGDAKPMWLAEFGFSSCYAHGRKDAAKDHVCLTRSGQAHALTDLLGAISGVSWIKAAVVYTLDDESTAYQFGLFDAKGRRKPAGTAVQRAFTGKRMKVTKPTLRLSRSGGRVVVRASGSWVEVYGLRVRVHGVLRYRAYLRTDRFGAMRVVLPKALGTTGVSVSLQGRWTKAQVTRRT